MDELKNPLEETEVGRFILTVWSNNEPVLFNAPTADGSAVVFANLTMVIEGK